MAITKETIYDYEIVGDYSVQVRRIDSYVEDGEVLSNSLLRHVIHPDSDWSSESTKIKALCDAFFTDEVKTSYETFKQEFEDSLS